LGKEILKEFIYLNWIKILKNNVLSVVKNLSGIKIMYAGLADHSTEENHIEVRVWII
jgi:hypothetical protein